MNKAAVITGGGSGVGRAVALRLAKEGWSLALVGRTMELLEETLYSCREMGARVIAVHCDVADPDAVHKAASLVLDDFGTVAVLVNSAGTNIPKRSLSMVNVADYQSLIDVNLNGTFYWVHALLPSMRARNNGTIINIVSDAGLIANAKAGPAYVASKFGVTGLTQSINAEERGNGIRATAICPGDINTPILDKRPQPPSADARLKMLQPEDVAECVMLAINLPPRAIVEQLVIRPR